MTTAASLLAGFAQVDITPPAGTHLAGNIDSHRPARLVWEPLFARAMVVECSGRRVCVLTLDVTLLAEPCTRRIRDAAAERFGLAPEAVMVHATQTHSAPALGRVMLDPDFPLEDPEFEWVTGAEASYTELATARAIEAIGLACEALEPAAVGAGRCIEGRLAFNRRAVMRNGLVSMPGRTWAGPLGPTEIAYIEGPIDPEVGVLCFRRPSLQLAGIAASYACHPVHVFPRPVVSPDWPGALCNALRARHGEGCVPIAINGACGNINPWPPFDPDYVEDHRAMGETLAADVERALETVSFADEARIEWLVRKVALPLREVPAEELAWASDILDRQPAPVWADEEHTRVPTDWMVAASIYSVHLMRRRSPVLDYEVQVLRIGDSAIVGLPGEPFVEGGLQIKLASPASYTHIAHCTTQYVGYIPTSGAMARGGHEVNTRYWAKLAPEALELVVQEATGALADLFG